MSLCYIVGAGEFAVSSPPPPPGSFVIAADGGYTALVSRGYVPDLVVGDFDSLPAPPDHPNVLQYPPEKDDTDLLLAVQAGLSRGCGRFILCGCLGGRLDHTLGNLQALAYLTERGARGVLVGADTNLTAVKNGEARFTAAASGLASAFAYGDPARGVTIEGMKYTARELTLLPDLPRGVSNEFLGGPARFSVREGLLLLTWTGELTKTLEGFLL